MYIATDKLFRDFDNLDNLAIVIFPFPDHFHQDQFTTTN